MIRFIAASLLVAIAGCAGMEVGVMDPTKLPRGFSQPGSPFPYNSTGW